MTYIKGNCRAAVFEIKKAVNDLKLTASGEKGVSTSSAFQWLNDNFYILSSNGKNAANALKKVKEIPLLSGGKRPLFWEDMLKFVTLKKGEINEEALLECVTEIQKARMLTVEEFNILIPVAVGALVLFARKGVAEDNGEYIASAVTSLRNIDAVDLDKIIMEKCVVEQIYMEDFTKIYPQTEEKSRALYRLKTAKVAKKEGISEEAAAREILNEAREKNIHLGKLLFTPPKKSKGRAWIALNLILPLILSLAISLLAGNIFLSLLLYLPLTEILRPILDCIFLKITPATYLPRFEFKEGIPEEGKTLAVISALLTDVKDVRKFCDKLERFYYSNGGKNICFGILADFKDKETAVSPNDTAIKRALKKGIRELSEKYGKENFCAFIRSRTFCKTQGRYSGWERKRGAILELISFILGKETSISFFEGDLRSVKKTKFIITLDADTELLIDTARAMTSVMLHPCNRAEVENGKITSGYGILAPRISVELNSFEKSIFSSVSAGRGGVSSYEESVGDIYEDLFGKGIFAGKGIIDVEAANELLQNALPENYVLSHDILEGNILNAGYISDIELTDGEPSTVISYFGRLHRWARGDTQNLRFIFDKKQGSLGKFKLIDNFRRIITPAFVLLSVFLSAFLPLTQRIALLTVSILAMADGDLFSAIYSLFSRGPKYIARKYYNRVMPSVWASLSKCGMKIVLYCENAFVLLDAMLRAFWRMITGKNLLEWATAAEGEKRNTKSANFLVRKFYKSIIFSVVLLVFAFNSPTVLILASIWLSMPIPAFLWSKTRVREERGFTDRQREELLSDAAAMWHFFEDFAIAKDNYLPPDNFEESPVKVTAHRTSPTNIGMYMLSALSARDLDLIDTESMTDRLILTLESIAKLKKWKGNLYNWYDTKTLKPLTPAYISSVDSGNFVCSLIALKEGLKEYLSQDKRLWDIILTLEKIINETDIAVFYNDRRKAMHIGYDISKGEMSSSFYDLLMSEALMTVYYAIASGQTEKKQFSYLGRMLARNKGYTGAVSWTGTMFEYFMPPLLLPVYKGSLISETLRFAYFCQRDRMRGKNLPWGISESGFYAFDSQLNYQYKAHGVGKLALKRGMNLETVISPYSTYLTLPFEKQGSISNLKKLKKMGLYGNYGCYEAVDATNFRTGGGTAIIKSYMSHHVGMSIVAITNALKGNVFSKRFMSDKRMSSGSELLMERIPLDSIVFEERIAKNPPEKPSRALFDNCEYDKITPYSPRSQVISNGDYCVMTTDCGIGYSSRRGVLLTRKSNDIFTDPCGFFALIKSGGKVMPLALSPDYSDGFSHQVRFSLGGASHFAHKSGIDAALITVVDGRISGEARQIALKNLTNRKQNVSLLCYCEPILSTEADFEAHKAYSKLFITCKGQKDKKSVTFSRREKDDDGLSLSFVTDCPNECEFETRRERVLSKIKGIFSLKDAFDKDFSGISPVPIDPCFAMKTTVTLPPRGQKSVTVYLAADENAGKALEKAEALKNGGINAMQNSLKATAKNLSAISKLDEMENTLLNIMLPFIEGLNEGTKETLSGLKTNTFGLSGLWSLGLSGDLPIVLCELSFADENKIRSFIKIHNALRLRGVIYDTVFAYSDGGEYNRPIGSKIREIAAKEGAEFCLNAKGGIHSCDVSVTPHIIDLLRAAASYTVSPKIRTNKDIRKYTPREISYIKKEGGYTVEEKKVTIENMPTLPWCHILSNEHFGTLLSDSSLGYTWANSSRENKLTPWSNDAVYDNRGEKIYISYGGKFYDAAASSKCEFYPEKAVYTGKFEDNEIKITVSVCGNELAKRVSVTAAKPCEVTYYTEPLLGVFKKTSRYIKAEKSENIYYLSNAFAGNHFGTMLLFADKDFSVCREKRKFFAGETGEDVSVDNCFAMTAQLNENEEITFFMGFAWDKEKAYALCDRLKNSTELTPSVTPAIKVKTPDSGFNALINTFLPLQIVRSRIEARCGFYQCGGAYGFRDQLQDISAAVTFDKNMARRHILRAASRQFIEGDVLHWWHEIPNEAPRGARTKCSDDLLWLPDTVCRYVEVTGDYSVLDEDVPYLEGEKLEGANEKYIITHLSDLSENLYRHCVKAIEYADKYGEHGLCLMGSCDWNDGFSNVGTKGMGESVWLSMYYVTVLNKFSEISASRGDKIAEAFKERAEKLKENIDLYAWDGGHYLRAFNDDGFALGSVDNEEGKIDSLPQSFAVFCGLSDKKRVEIALNAAVKELVTEDGIIKLFTPPYQKGEINPGYVYSYPAGIRENGGQYTHAAVWLAMALYESGEKEKGEMLMRYLSPIFHSQDENYLTEPYFMAADIYTAEGNVGRGGWTMYTGAAGWYYRLLTENVLGIKIRGDEITVNPNLPKDWDNTEAEVNLGDKKYRISYRDGKAEVNAFS